MFSPHNTLFYAKISNTQLIVSIFVMNVQKTKISKKCQMSMIMSASGL